MSTTHLDRKDVSQGSVHLDTIRGVAALIVFINHTRALYFSSVLSSLDEGTTATHAIKPSHIPLGMPAGKVKFANEAVIIFFVLSGYLVGGSVLRLMQKARWSWKAYLAKRLTRLWMVLIPALILGVALDYFGSRHFGPQSVYTTSNPLAFGNTKNLAYQLKPSVILGNLFFLQTILVPPAGTNISLWSLACEFWYYIAFPLGLLALVSGRSVVSRLIYGLAACGVLYFVGWSVAALFPLWVLGALVVLLPASLTTSQSKALSVVLTLSLIGAMGAVRIAGLSVIPAWYVIGILSCALIYVLSQNTTPAKNSKYRNVSNYFSHVSYSLYLFHLPIATFLCGILDHPWRPWAKTPKNLVIWMLSDVFILLIVTGLWFLFESRTDRVRLALFAPAVRTVKVGG